MYLSNLQSYLFGLILILFMGFVACEKSIDELPTIEYGKTTIIGENKSINYKSLTNNQLKLTVEAIQNNFCPKGFICLLAGYAEVKIKILNQNNQNIKFSLFFGDYYGHPKKLAFKPDTLDFNLNQKAYQAILKSIKNENNDKILKAEIVLLEK